MNKFTTTYLKLNGYTNGFALYLYGTGHFLKDEKGKKKKLFRSIEECRIYAYNNISHDPYKYQIWIVFNGVEIPYESTQHFGGYHEYYDSKNRRLYRLEEIKQEIVSSIGYFVFEEKEEDNKVYTKEDMKNISKNLYQYIRDILYHKISDSILEASDPFKLYLDEDGNMSLRSKQTSLKYHLLYNSQIIDINIVRKEKGYRCIPFIKSMDKYKSLYIYTSYIKGLEYEQEQIDSVIQYILDKLNEMDYGFTCKYVPVEFGGMIRVR